MCMIVQENRTHFCCFAVSTCILCSIFFCFCVECLIVWGVGCVCLTKMELCSRLEWCIFTCIFKIIMIITINKIKDYKKNPKFCQSVAFKWRTDIPILTVLLLECVRGRCACVFGVCGGVCVGVVFGDKFE